MAYTKLFDTIISSSIWSEDDKTRILWVTMLAMADKNGEVHASIPGLARLAGISVSDTEKAMAKFLSPDKHSRTKDLDGRRVAEIEGGWDLINHAKYRRMASKEEQAEKNAERQARWRSRNKKRQGRNAPVTQDRDIAEAEADSDLRLGVDKSTPCPQADVVGAIWNAYPKRGRERSTRAKALKAWSSVPSKHRIELPAILTALESWKRCDE